MNHVKVYDPNISRVFAIDDSYSTYGESMYWNSDSTIIPQIGKQEYNEWKDYKFVPFERSDHL